MQVKMLTRSLLLLLVVVVCINAANVAIKNLAGPPSEFPSFAFPTPFHSADVQNSATFYVNFAPSTETSVVEAHVTLTVDSDKEFSFIFFSPFNHSVKLALKDPNGHSVILHGKETSYPMSDGDVHDVSGTEYRFKNPKNGNYNLTIKSKPLSTELFTRITTNTMADAYLMLWNEDALATHTSLNTYALLTGTQIGLVSRVFVESFSASEMKEGKAPRALRGSVTVAEMTVVYPDGMTIDTNMTDRGVAFDGEADDGVFGGLITAPVPGQYIFSATLKGVNPEGVNYIRTTQQLVTVVTPTLTLTGSAQGVLDHSSLNRMNIYIAAQAPAGKKYKAYAEVWGTDANGNDVPVAWVGGMTHAQDYLGTPSIALELDLNWLSMAGAQEPLVLRSVVIQDVDTFVPIAQVDQIVVKASPTALGPYMASLSLLGGDGEITEEMREGVRPARYLRAANVTADSAAIILVHGYCTDKNPFSVYAADWTNAHFYLNPVKNNRNDVFALDVIAWAEPFEPYSYVGHSQGGVVGLHIKNYYWSGMDQVTGGRLLQSVGTPYQGSSGAGSAADLAKVFGVLCGANQDLTKDGASLWLNGVTPQNRGLVYYYTSTYVQGKFWGDYCNLATNLVLSWPNDGVTEYIWGQLPGGQNQGNTEGWCHSVKMKYTPQSQNQERNALMNTQAARQPK